jgi:hypothetical protein
VVILTEFEVGYRRPPKFSQYQPGQSGNPRGRPKGSRKVADILRELLNAKITITEHGVSRRSSRLEVMILQLSNDATRGDKRALKLILDLTDRHGREDETPVRADGLASEDRAILEEFMRKRG